MPSVTGQSEAPGVSFILDEVNNPKDSACESGNVHWEAHRGDTLIGSGVCAEDDLNPLVLRKGEKAEKLKCDVPSLMWGGGPYTGKISWCGATAEFAYPTEEDTKLSIKSVPEADTGAPKDCVGASGCGAIPLVSSGTDCRIDQKCSSCYVIGKCCTFDKACCSGNKGQKDCGIKGNDCGPQEACVADTDKKECVCRFDASSCSGSCGGVCGTGNPMQLPYCGVNQRCVADIETGKCECKDAVDECTPKISLKLSDEPGGDEGTDDNGMVYVNVAINNYQYKVSSFHYTIDFGDGTPTHPNYFNIEGNSYSTSIVHYYPPGTYTVKFETDYGTVEDSIKVSSINAAVSCKDVLINGRSEDKIDIVFLVHDPYNSGNYDYTEDVKRGYDKIFSVEPFKTYRNRFNVHMVEGYHNFCEPADEHGRTVKCDYDKTLNVASVCPFDVAVLLVPNLYKEVAPDKLAIVDIGLHQQEIVHEFGHAFGGLWDEYPGGECPSGKPNCDTDPTCPKWKDLPGAGCFLKTFPDTENGVTKMISDGIYLSYDVNTQTNYCIMSDPGSPEFCPACYHHLVDLLDKYK